MATLALTEQEAELTLAALNDCVKIHGVNINPAILNIAEKIKAFKAENAPVDTTIPVPTETADLPEPEATFEPKDPNANLSCGLDGGCESCQ